MDPTAQDGWLDVDGNYATDRAMTFIVDGGFGDPDTGHYRDSTKETEWINCYESGNCVCITEATPPHCGRESGDFWQLSCYPLDVTSTCREEIEMMVDPTVFD